jgi:predicted alpha/beta hydrolase family esterase
MTNIYIFHGTHGYSGENWFPWLKEELEKLGCRVIVPDFPTPENQTLESWFQVLDKYKEFYDSNTILVGHSLGGAFALRVIEKFDVMIKAVFLISSPSGIVPSKFPGADKTDLPFVGEKFDWFKIKNKVGSVVVFQSDNDPYIDHKNTEDISKNLGAELIVVPNAGHFNEKAGYTKFDLLLNLLKEVLK